MVSVCLPSDALCYTYHLTWVSLTLDVGYLLTTAPPDLERGVAPLGPPAPLQPLLLGCGVKDILKNMSLKLVKWSQYMGGFCYSHFESQ